MTSDRLYICVFLQNNVDYTTYILLDVLVGKVSAKYTVILDTKIHNNSFIIWVSEKPIQNEPALVSKQVLNCKSSRQTGFLLYQQEPYEHSDYVTKWCKYCIVATRDSKGERIVKSFSQALVLVGCYLGAGGYFYRSEIHEH